MTMRKAGELLATVRTYRDSAGKPAKYRVRCGTLFKDDRSARLAIQIDALPLGEWDGWLAVVGRDAPEGGSE